MYKYIYIYSSNINTWCFWIYNLRFISIKHCYIFKQHLFETTTLFSMLLSTLQYHSFAPYQGCTLPVLVFIQQEMTRRLSPADSEWQRHLPSGAPGLLSHLQSWKHIPLSFSLFLWQIGATQSTPATDRSLMTQLPLSASAFILLFCSTFCPIRRAAQTYFPGEFPCINGAGCFEIKTLGGRGNIIYNLIFKLSLTGNLTDLIYL